MTFQLTSPDATRRVCTVSPCGLYRYELAELWDEANPFDLHVLCNPSTADGAADDATTRKLRGFAQRADRGGWAVCNPFAFRSTDPKALLQAVDPVGPGNEDALRVWMKRAAFLRGRIIVGWGRALPKQLRLEAASRVAALEGTIGCGLWCYGRTDEGMPRHPLMGAESAQARALAEQLRTALAPPLPPSVMPGARSQARNFFLSEQHTTHAPRPAPARTSTTTEKLAGGERKVLTALAQYPAGRTKVQVALLTGYAHNGGGFNNYLSSLRGRGLLEGSGESLRATDAGLAALGEYTPLPTGGALLEHWLGKLGKAERSVLCHLTAAYPEALSKERVAERAGYEPNGGGFNNALSRLRTLELISGRGELRASEDLFG
ncbi:MAG TPA: DUF1643 domain-containing protein [Polyangiales bacterium]|nr:DUF1643 domain-containing protein [Polyangiales bacterium]